MQFKALSVLALGATFATATVTPVRRTGEVSIPTSQCNNGSIECCQSVEQASNSTVALLLGLLGVVVPNANTLIGVNCTPVRIIGVGGNSGCSANAVCCSNNSFSGIISVGCNPIKL